MKKRNILLTLIPVLLVMVMIFCFSAQTGQTSGAMSGRITRWILERVVAGFAEMDPAAQAQLCSSTGLLIRKLAHFSEFALLGFFLMLHIRQIGRMTPVRLPWLWAWSIGTLYAVSDELHQGFVGGRVPAVMDVCIDSAGVVAGVMVLWLIFLGKNRT